MSGFKEMAHVGAINHEVHTGQGFCHLAESLLPLVFCLWRKGAVQAANYRGFRMLHDITKEKRTESCASVESVLIQKINLILNKTSRPPFPSSPLRSGASSPLPRELERGPSKSGPRKPMESETTSGSHVEISKSLFSKVSSSLCDRFPLMY